MKELFNELKFFINKELYQSDRISFSEFKLFNEVLLKDKNECFENKK